MEAGLEAVEGKKEAKKKKMKFDPPGFRTRDHSLGRPTPQLTSPPHQHMYKGGKTVLYLAIRSTW